MIKEHYTPILVGSNPFDIESIMGQLDRFFVVAHLPSQAAIDIALHDIKGKALGVPVYQLLGGLVRETVQLLAPQIQRATPKDQAKEAVSWVERGFSNIKIKVGGNDVEKDVRRVREVRRAVGDTVAIRIDANQYYDPLSAVKLIKKLEPYDLEWVEDPVATISNSWDIEALAYVHSRVNAPVMAGQLGTPTDVLRVIRREAADCLKIKLIRGGGLLKLKQSIAIAQAANISLVTGNGGDNDINFAAEVHLNASSGHLTRANREYGRLDDPREVSTLKEPLTIKGDLVYVPRRPGLGVELVDVERLEDLLPLFPSESKTSAH